MNTIPSTFNERQIQRTVVSGTEPVPNPRLPLAVILLNVGAGGVYRVKILESLIKNGFSSIICIDRTAENYNVEELAQRFNCVKFIVPNEPVTIGDMINIGMSETDEDHVLVIKDSIHITPNLIVPEVIEKYVTKSCFCLVPRLLSPQKQPLPIRFTPIVENSSFGVQVNSIIGEKSVTLFPFDYIGIYNRHQFMRLGGFDYTITSEYWQNLDLSVRAWLWGEKIMISPVMQMEYASEVPESDSTADVCQLRFYLKNGAPKFSLDRCYIPITRFFNYMKRSRSGFSRALKDFREARHWVAEKKYCFRQDITMLIEKWSDNI